MIVSVIDIGTFTTRLAIADVAEGQVQHLEKKTVITDLGEGVAESGVLKQAAIERVLARAKEFRELAATAGAEVCAVTLTSAARDAANASELTDALEALGLVPQVIPGEIEGKLTFTGVAQDAYDCCILVADSGGGSTELACGSLGATLSLPFVQSLNVGCRRVTDLFLLREDPPSAADIKEARAWVADIFAPAAAELAELSSPKRLFAVGGTATSLSAMTHGVVPYDASRVHLSQITHEQVDEQVARLSALTAAERSSLPGLQAKRSSVIVAGALTLSELMAAFKFDELTVSEHDLLYGLAAATQCAAQSLPSALGWTPQISRF